MKYWQPSRKSPKTTKSKSLLEKSIAIQNGTKIDVNRCWLQRWHRLESRLVWKPYDILTCTVQSEETSISPLKVVSTNRRIDSCRSTITAELARSSFFIKVKSRIHYKTSRLGIDSVPHLFDNHFPLPDHHQNPLYGSHKNLQEWNHLRPVDPT